MSGMLIDQNKFTGVRSSKNIDPAKLPDNFHNREFCFGKYKAGSKFGLPQLTIGHNRPRMGRLPDSGWSWCSEIVTHACFCYSMPAAFPGKRLWRISNIRDQIPTK